MVCHTESRWGRGGGGIRPAPQIISKATLARDGPLTENRRMTKKHSQVLVLGCGPAGAAAAALLAKAGVKVRVLEAGGHPRHHIGESLLPQSMPILHEAGLGRDFMELHHHHKCGARFFDPASGDMRTFEFASLANGDSPPAFQVIRSIFDQQLRDASIAAGAEVLEHRTVVDADISDKSVRLQCGDGTQYTADFLLDASGAAGFVARRLGARKMLPDFGRLAIYNYFQDLPPAAEHERQYITMHMISHGWIWCIPLRDGSTSIGAVLAQKGIGKNLDLQQQFMAAVAQSPTRQARIGRVTPLAGWRVASDYSYRCPQKAGPRFMLIGDAGGFLDPIFSSGVHLALTSASLAAAAVTEFLGSSATDKLSGYSETIDQGLAVFESFVGRFYQRDLVRNLFFATHQPVADRNAIIGILSGDVWNRTNPLVNAILSRREKTGPNDGGLQTDAAEISSAAPGFGV